MQVVEIQKPINNSVQGYLVWITINKRNTIAVCGPTIALTEQRARTLAALIRDAIVPNPHLEF